MKNLDISYPGRFNTVQATQNVSFDINAGEILGLVGESGSGKSTIANAIIGLLPRPGIVTGGKITLKGEDILTTDKIIKSYRGKRIGFIFQDPMTSLNPVFTIGQQIIETLIWHLNLTPENAYTLSVEKLKAVGLPETVMEQYPHQFSGGMRQRAVIAIALACEPDLIIADEPTTALDVSLQDQILNLIRDLVSKKQAGVLLITHDMGVVAKVTKRIVIMFRGKIVEQGETLSILRNPQHDYTKSLIAAVPPIGKKLHRFPYVDFIEGAVETPQEIDNAWLSEIRHKRKGDESTPLLEVKDINLSFQVNHAIFKKNQKWVHVLKGVSAQIKRGETLGLVGESGSGKSTLARVVTGLYKPQSGAVIYHGQDMLGAISSSARRQIASRIQMVFQNPYSSLNPKKKVQHIISEPIFTHHLASQSEIPNIVAALLQQVGLPADAAEYYPHSFSGGQRQRISIARALASKPELLVCDEPTSALDVSVQAQILNLLKDLQESLGLSMLFISHDLPVVRQISHHTAVMYQGRIIEQGETERVFEHPETQYTTDLLRLMPALDDVI